MLLDAPRTFARLCLALALCTSAQAASELPDLKPGAWRVAIAMEVPNATGPSTGPAQYERCVSAEDVRNLLFIPEGAGCSILESKLSAQSLSWTVRCSQAGYASTATGRIEFRKTTMEGKIVTVAEGKSDLRITTRLSGRYIGECVSPSKPPAAAAAAPPRTKLPDFK